MSVAQTKRVDRLFFEEAPDELPRFEVPGSRIPAYEMLGRIPSFLGLPAYSPSGPIIIESEN